MPRTNSIAMRYDFENAASVFAQAFGMTIAAVKSTFKLTQSFLRLEQPFTTANATLTFPVLNNIQAASGQYPTEQRLNQQDSFIPTKMGVYINPAASATDVISKLLAYPNPTILTAPNAIAMQVLYNGKMVLTVNNVVYIPAWDIFKHYCANQTQQNVATATATDNVDQFYGDEDGKYPMQPYVALIGSKNIQLQIQMPAAPTAIAANSRCVVWFDGILAQNSTVVV